MNKIHKNKKIKKKTMKTHYKKSVLNINLNYLYTYWHVMKSSSDLHLWNGFFP